MSDYPPKCRICDKQCNPWRGAVPLDNLPSGHDVPICDVCLGQIVRQVLNVGGSHRPFDAEGFCWLCGGTEDLHRWERVGSRSRTVRMCDACARELRSEARQRAGIPDNWETQPRVCGTCLNERDKRCHRDPPTVVPVTDENDPNYTTCAYPHVSGKNDGCETGWRPKVRTEEKA